MSFGEASIWVYHPVDWPGFGELSDTQAGPVAGSAMSVYSYKWWGLRAITVQWLKRLNDIYIYISTLVMNMAIYIYMYIYICIYIYICMYNIKYIYIQFGDISNIKYDIGPVIKNC